MNDDTTGPLDLARIAESIASELAIAADQLGRKGNAVVARALLEEARRHTVHAIRLRAHANPQQGKAKHRLK